MGPFAFAPNKGATQLNLDINEAVLLQSSDDLDNLMVIVDGLFPEPDDDGHLKPWTIVNRGRLTSVAYGCPTDAMLHFHCNITKAGDPLRSEFARNFGKTLHDVVAAVTTGSSPAASLAGYTDATDEALTSLIQEQPDGDLLAKCAAKVDQWRLWLHKAAPVIQIKLALGAYGSPTSMTKVETPIGIAWPLEKIIVMTIPDGIGVWNDGGWCFEAKSIAANRSLHQAAMAYERSLQVTIQSLATMLQLKADGNDVPFMGTMIDFYVKRSVPTSPDDVKCAKLCECGAAQLDSDMLSHTDIEHIALAHPRASLKDANWIRDHVDTESGKLANYSRKVTKASADAVMWPETIFKRVPTMLSLDDLQRRISRDLGSAIQRYQWWRERCQMFAQYSSHPPLYEMDRNTDECFVYSPCSMNSICNDQVLSTLMAFHNVTPPEGYVTRQPDYVDVVAGGGWPDEGYDVYEWDDDE